MPKYPWDMWLVPGQSSELTQHVHFGCSMESMKQQVRNAARAMGVFVSITPTSRWSITITTRSRPDGRVSRS